MQNLIVNAERLWEAIHETAVYGACDGGGITRLSLSDEDREVRKWFQRTAEGLGCTVKIDGVGNMFATKPGKDPSLAPIAIGSHLDTQPAGGKFDGVLGVLSGLEILKVLEEAEFITNAPLEIINWTNEEGARFSPALLASGVFAGVHEPEFALSRTDSSSLSFGEELERIGFKGDEPIGGRRLAAMFELHIEQGPNLEAEDLDVGVVTRVQGVRWYDVALVGKTGHTGATPMGKRKNALLGAAEIVIGVDKIANVDVNAVATVGSMDVEPNSRNVIPGKVSFTADLRHPNNSILGLMSAQFEELLTRVAREHGLEFELKPVFIADTMEFDQEAIQCVEAGARAAGLKYRSIISGASHDAVHIAKVAPTAMIFSPCRDGVSHSVDEYVSKEQCAKAAQALLNAVVIFDRKFESPKKEGLPEQALRSPLMPLST